MKKLEMHKFIGLGLWYVKLFCKDWGIAINEGGRGLVFVLTNKFIYLAIQIKFTIPVKFIRLHKDFA